MDAATLAKLTAVARVLRGPRLVIYRTIFEPGNPNPVETIYRGTCYVNQKLKSTDSDPTKEQT